MKEEQKRVCLVEFKLNYYFEKLKDTSFNSRNEFRERFIKKYGNYQYLSELIVMIENYQIKKYGTRLTTGNFREKTREDRIKETNKEWQRRKARLGR